jgi:hypothetical protein
MPDRMMFIFNDFLRREVSFELMKWIMEGRIQKSVVTQDSTFIAQMNDPTELKKRVNIITVIVAEKASNDLQTLFNRFYRPEITTIKGDPRPVDSAMREYIARFVFYMIRRLSYDISLMLSSDEYGDQTLDKIINAYIVSLEETIYRDNGVFLIHFDDDQYPKKEQLNGI